MAPHERQKKSGAAGLFCVFAQVLPERDDLIFEWSSRSSDLFVRDLFRNPGATFRDHALPGGEVQALQQRLPELAHLLMATLDRGGHIGAHVGKLRTLEEQNLRL
jgi:hypothetical protein